MYRGARVAVVVPAFNEALLIGRALRQIPSWVDLVLVVDDASVDDTAQRASELGAVVLRHEQNRGVGAAIVTGYDTAFARGIDIAAVMAGDAQMDGADLGRLLDPLIEGGASYAKGNRLLWPRARSAMPGLRFWGNRALSWLTRLATGLVVGDSQCGYTALTRRAARQLNLRGLWPRYGYPNDLLGQLALSELKVAEVAVRPIYGEEKSGIGWRHALLVIPWLLLRIAIRRWRHRALRGATMASDP